MVKVSCCLIHWPAKAIGGSLLVLLAGSAFADTYKSVKACHEDIAAAVSRFERDLDSEPASRTEPSKNDASIFSRQKQLESLCDVGYVYRVVLAPVWPENEKPWDTIEYKELLPLIRLQLQKSLPDFPVYIDARDIPPSFRKEWESEYIKKNGSPAKRVSFWCTSRIAGKASGGGISSALRAHLLTCHIQDMEFSHLGIIEDDKFLEQFKKQLEFVVNDLAESWNLVKRH